MKDTLALEELILATISYDNITKDGCYFNEANRRENRLNLARENFLKANE